MFHQQNNLNNIPLHVPMPMHPLNHFPNQVEELSPPSPIPDANQDGLTEVINISKIKDGFFIGDKLAAISIDVLIQFKITHFINATGNQIMNQWESVGIIYLTLNWSENERQILFDGKDEIAERIVQFIDNSFIEGEGLLAHSFKGQNRVCLVVLIYLMKKYKWSLNKSMDYLKSKKNDVDIVPYFYIQLVKFEERLKKRGELNSDIPWPSTYLLKDKEEKLICNTYMNGLPLDKDTTNNNKTNNDLIRHIIWNDENPSQKGPLEIVDREHDLFLEKDIKPVTCHQRIRPTKKCIKSSKNNINNINNIDNIFNNNLIIENNKNELVNNFMEKNDNIQNNIGLIAQDQYEIPNNNLNQNNQLNNYKNNNIQSSYNLGSLNSLNPTNIQNYGVIYDNNNNINNNNKIINKNGINFNKNNNFNNQEFIQNNNQINNTNTSINMKKSNNQIQNNNHPNKQIKRASSNKKSDKSNNLSNSSQNFIHNKLNNNMNQVRPLINSMNDFIDKRNKMNNNENINNNMINNDFIKNAPLVEDIYGNNFDYIKHNNNTFLSNNNYNNKIINNNKINKASYAINYNNNIHNGYNNIIKNKPLNNFNPNLIKKKSTPQSGHTLLNRNKSNLEEGPVKIKKNNYLKNNNNGSNFNYNSNKKPTTPDLNHYNTAGFLSENNTNYNTNSSMNKTNGPSYMGVRGNSLQKSEKSNGIFGYGTKTNFKTKFSIKRPATAPHKDKVKVPVGAINKKNYGINGDKKPKIGKFNQRPQSAEGKNNKNLYKNYNSANNYGNNINGIMGYNKHYSNSNITGIINNKKYGINNMKNNLQNKRINSPINVGNSNNIHNKNLFNGSKYNNPKYRIPSPMIKPTNNIQRKNVVGNNGNKIGTNKNNNINFK